MNDFVLEVHTHNSSHGPWVLATCLSHVSHSHFSTQGGAKVVVEPHRHPGIFIARGKEDALVTKNTTPGKDVYGEKRISVDAPGGEKVRHTNANT